MTTVREATREILQKKNDPFLLDMYTKSTWFYNQEKIVANVLKTKYNTDLATLTFESSPDSDKTLLSGVKAENRVKESSLNDNRATINRGVGCLLPVKTAPYAHQKDAFTLATSIDASALFMEMGTGKTLVAIATAGYRFWQGQVKNLLVICPKSVMPVWAKEFEKHADFPVSVLTSPWNPVIPLKDKLNVYIINYESAWRKEKQILLWKPDMVILDESQRIKSHTATQSKFCHKLGDKARYKMLLSGTPITQNLIDGFSQYKFLNKNIFGPYITKFKEQYCIIDNYLGFEQIKGYKNVEDFAQKLHSIAYRVTKDECLDLPPIVDKIEYCYLSDNTRKLYDQMNEDMMIDLRSQGEEPILAPFVVVKLIRLQQMTGGFIGTDDKKVEPLGTEKLDLLASIVEDMPADKKLVVFARFRSEIDAIEARLSKLGRTVVTLTGSTGDREAVLDAFQEDSRVTVIVVQIQAGGVGVTLTASDTVIYYSTTFSYADYEQSRARVHRIGQKSDKVTYIHLVAKDTVDEQVIKALERKQDLAKYIVDDMKNIK